MNTQRRETKEEQISRYLNRALENIFALLPHKDKKCGEAIDFKLPAKYASHPDLIKNKEAYGTFAVRCMYEMFRFVKDLNILTEFKWNAWSDSVKLAFVAKKLGVRGSFRSANIKNYAHFVDPMMYLVSTNDSYHEFFEDEAGVWRLDGIGAEYERHEDKNENLVIFRRKDSKEEVMEKDSKKEWQVELDSSWLPHIIDDLTFKLALEIRAFLDSIQWAAGADLPEHNQIREKLAILDIRILRYVYTIGHDNFAEKIESFKKISPDCLVLDEYDQFEQGYQKSRQILLAIVSNSLADKNVRMKVWEEKIRKNDENLVALKAQVFLEKARRFIKQNNLNKYIEQQANAFTQSININLQLSEDKPLAQYIKLKKHCETMSDAYNRISAIDPFKLLSIKLDNLSKEKKGEIMEYVEFYLNKQYLIPLKESIKEALESNKKKLELCKEQIKKEQDKKLNDALQIWSDNLAEDLKASLPNNINELKNLIIQLESKIKTISENKLTKILDEKEEGGSELEAHLAQIHQDFNLACQNIITGYQKKLAEIHHKIIQIEAEDDTKSTIQIELLSKKISALHKEFKKIHQADQAYIEIEKNGQSELKQLEEKHHDLMSEIKQKEIDFNKAQGIHAALEQDTNKLRILLDNFIRGEFKVILTLFNNEEYKRILGIKYQGMLKIVDSEVNQRGFTSLLSKSAWTSWSNRSENIRECISDINGLLISLEKAKPNIAPLAQALKTSEEALEHHVLHEQNTEKLLAEKALQAKVQQKKAHKASHHVMNQHYIELEKEIKIPDLKDEKQDLYGNRLQAISHAYIIRQKSKMDVAITKYEKPIADLEAGIADVKNMEDLDKIDLDGEIKKIIEIQQDLVKIRHLNHLQPSFQRYFKQRMEKCDVFQERLQTLHHFFTHLMTLRKITASLIELERRIQEKNYDSPETPYKQGIQPDNYIENEFEFYHNAKKQLNDMKQSLKTLLKAQHLPPYVKSHIASCMQQRKKIKVQCQTKHSQWKKLHLVKGSQFFEHSKNDYKVNQIKAEINDHDFTGIRISNICFAQDPLSYGPIAFGSFTKPTPLLNVKLDYARLTKCHFAMPMENVSFKGAKLISCTFKSFKGTILDENTEILDENKQNLWSRLSGQILIDHLTQPPFKPEDKPYLAELINIVHRKDDTLIDAAFILRLVSELKDTDIDLSAKRAQAKFIVENMLPKINSFKELAKLHTLLTQHQYAYLKPKLFDRDATYKDIIQLIQARAYELVADPEVQKKELWMHEQQQLNSIMNYGKRFYSESVNVGVLFYKKKIDSKVPVEEKSKLTSKLRQLENNAHLYAAQSLQHPYGALSYIRIGKYYRKKLFNEAIQLLNIALNEKNLEAIEQIRKIIRDAYVTRLGGNHTFPHDGHHQPDMLPTTLGGLLMDRICANLLKINDVQDASIKKQIADDLRQLHRNYSNLPQLKDYEPLKVASRYRLC